MVVAQSLLPIFALILFGLLLARRGFPAKDFWPQAERLIYWLLFPCLLFTTLATARGGGEGLFGMATALVVAVLVISSLVLVSRPAWPLSAAAFTSVFQGAIRQNTYVGLAGAFALAGSEGLNLAAVAIATLIPLLNILCVGVLVVLRDSGERGWSALGREVLRNPLILACALGIGVNAVDFALPAWLLEAMALLGRASLPLGLLAVGAALRLSAERREVSGIVLSTFPKLILMPLVVWYLCGQLQVPEGPTRIAVLFGALPTSVSSFILARQLGGDEHLMASIITAQTLLAMVTLPLVLDLLTGP
jgi:predicted permease